MKYASLAPGEIRLLTIYPSRYHKAFLRCQLHHEALNGAVYDALSYAWGTSGQTEHIYVDEEEVAVTPSLLAALRHLRDREKSRTLWVDALCINQADDDEKSAQVQQMGDVYRNARQTACWLGEADDSSDVAMQFIRAVNLEQETKYNCLQQEPPEEDAPYADRVQSESSRARNPRPSGLPPLLEELSEFIPWFTDLFGREYWKRIWTVQEMALGGNVVVYCGQETADWTTFDQVFPDWLSCHMEQDTSDSFHHGIILKSSYLPASTSALRKIVLGDSAGAVLFETLVKYRVRDASDPRDKVFGLLGVCSHEGLEADYTKRISQVYREVAKYIIEKEQNLDVLSAIRNYDRQSYFSLARDLFKVSLKSLSCPGTLIPFSRPLL